MMATATPTTRASHAPRFATDVRRAIETRCLGPTNRLGTRIVARCAARSITVPWDHALGIECNHRTAAEALICKLGWFGEGWSGMWHQGGDATGDGYVFTFALEPNDFDAAPSRLEALHHEQAKTRDKHVRAAYLGALKFHFHGLLLTQGAPTSKLVRRRMWAIAKTKAERAAERAARGDPRPITCRVWNPSDAAEGWS